ncbi:class I SAM-dependent methyltransferase family protein [Candidatus Woesearchaeota archaeon]|nr:class I SAM-dependent methyltransferase family protein [Candidatus Woesearchaeota archaeon]
MPDLKAHLKSKLAKSQLGLVRNAFDIVGSVALLEIPRELKKKQKIIANAVLQAHKNIKAVYVEVGGRKGKLRLQKLQWLAGSRNTETVATENGVQLKLDVAKVYYSPRQASERKRIYQQVKSGEEVLVMFSGAAPYVIEIAKHTNAEKVFGIEVNRAAHKYAAENVKLNKVDAKVKLYCGDVKKILPQLGSFSRIVMPLPKGAGHYLGIALKHTKHNGAVHFYDFQPQAKIPFASVEKVRAAAVKQKKKIRIIKTVKCGQLAPRAYRVCVDFQVV